MRIPALAKALYPAAALIFDDSQAAETLERPNQITRTRHHSMGTSLRAAASIITPPPCGPTQYRRAIERADQRSLLDLLTPIIWLGTVLWLNNYRLRFDELIEEGIEYEDWC